MQHFKNFSTQLLRLKSSHLVASTIWSTIGEAIYRGTALVTSTAVARILGAADFGVFGLIRNGALQIGSVGEAGLGLTANRHIPSLRVSDPATAGALVGATLSISLLLGMFLALLGGLASDWIAATYLGDPGLQFAVNIGIVLVAVAGINSAQLGVLRGLEAFRTLATGYLVVGLIGGGALILGGIFFGVRGALIALVVTAVANLACFQFLIRRELSRAAIRVEWVLWGKIRPILITFSVPVALIVLAIGPLRWIAESLLVKSAGTAEAGVFYVGMIVYSLLVGLVSTMHSPLVASLARRHSQGAIGELQWISLYASWFAFLALSSPILLFPEIFSRVFGEQFPQEQLARVVLLFVVYSGLTCYAQGLSRAITQYGSMWWMLAFSLVESAVLLTCFLLIPNKNATSLVVALIVSYVARLTLTLPYVVGMRVLAARALGDLRFLVSLALFLIVVVGQWRNLAGLE